MRATDPALSEAMAAALVDSLRKEIGGICFVYCHEGTRRALVARGLAVREPAGRSRTRTVLTDAGREAAERILAQTTPRTSR